MASPGARDAESRLRDWRSWPTELAFAWRRSLRFRTVLLTLGLSALAVLASFVFMALAIQNDLFQSRLEQVLDDASRTTQTAQATLDSAEVAGDPVAVDNLLVNVSTVARQASTQMTAALRTDTTSPLAPQGFTTGGLNEDYLSAGLRASVQDGPELQWWQSVALPDGEGGTVPGIIVGQQLLVPEVGAYELYFGYDLADASQTLGFVQATLWIVAGVLVLLLGAISWIVLRSVTRPIADAARTSERLAEGDLGVRLQVRGDDELATLARSFNAMADSIESQIKDLADLSLVQQRFVSDVSHELRTPLTTIRLASDMLNDRRDEFDPATARAAELLHAQVQRFETLLTDLLEISRYDAGSVQLETEPTSMAQLAEDVIASMQQLADQHGTDVRLIAPGGYSPVDMDPRRVRRIVRNLLGNAIEHGEGRPIVVTVDSDQRAVALGVRDYGLGMTAADAERVFDRFWRADPARTRTIGGTGLGLSIALGDARLHRGTLAVWSQLGRGTHFVLTIPRHDADLDGASPIPADPGDDATFDTLGLTQPIEIPPADRRERR
ncbi:MtrAB system histidine kinase MtrB [Microbacterium sp. zg.Y1090]|uniref:MtrAB system histidine kinase MtrB n=1 Tax=Microbacterium TaxID=33882 RepID=UPI00214C38CB|nr:MULTISPECIES: MtrAB system histidine kinase MtrB [unclassified Microbacterium]MCR2813559.1 MtrAB system histidine kinase MtrB [Microbacterium sp. zg.Y1084]MCR2818104.1 MtrAB system histidine kinase MtrB [Microbacterium sp. zg.Y1090]MDL5486626.1 MtrAB system histidine kinase MtrB [Microbacterium sp. zg-Y1211]WIM27740.1 MtrAB system histidine kinase MtrB [Microbacterium sp. zg-Y1090]